jgi:hypothetical protein
MMKAFPLHSCFLPYHPCQSPHPVRKVRHIVGVPWVRPVNAAVLTAGRIRPTSVIACTLASRPMGPAPINPTRIIPARTSCPGMHSLAATAPATPHGEPTPIDPSRIISARTSCPGMHSLAATMPATPHGEPTPIDPSRIIPTRTSCPRVCPGYFWPQLYRIRVHALLAWLWSAGPFLQNTPHSLAPDKHFCHSKA